LKINNVNDNLNFKARVTITNPEKLIDSVKRCPEELSARIIQNMIDTITLTKETAPLVGTEKDVIGLDFGETKSYSDLFEIRYNNQSKGFLAVSENPLSAIAGKFEELTDGIITRADSLEQFKSWQAFSLLKETGQIQRLLYKQNAKGRFTVAKTQITTIEELMEKLKKIIGLS